MGIFISFLFFTSSFWALGTAYAHPVSYKGSRGLIGSYSPALSHNQFNYSFKHWFATGIHHIQSSVWSDTRASFVSANILLKRWNTSGLQANIYSVVGVGRSHLGSSDESAGLGAVRFDIEDRNYYFLSKHLRVFNKKQTDLEQTVVRAGFAPYVEQFDGIHSWLILEFQRLNFVDIDLGVGDTNITIGRDLEDVTVFLRIFYKNLLFEIGQSFDGVTKFNYVTFF